MRYYFLFDNLCAKSYNGNDRKSKQYYKGSITMRLKKGFTLAEILIVLMVIGVIATMTVPSMMKGVTETQYKTGFKKAYNTISNLTARLAVDGKMPVKMTKMDEEANRFFIAMIENLSVREITKAKISSRAVATRDSEVQLTYTVDNNQKVYGTGSSVTINNNSTWPTGDNQLWLTTDDGLAYTLEVGTDCDAKNIVSQKTKLSDLKTSSCLVVVVDVNGLNKTPNYEEPQADITTTNADMQPLTGDQFRIFVARDGITPGSKLNQAAARIIADMK